MHDRYEGNRAYGFDSAESAFAPQPSLGSSASAFADEEELDMIPYSANTRSSRRADKNNRGGKKPLDKKEMSKRIIAGIVAFLLLVAIGVTWYVLRMSSKLTSNIDKSAMAALEPAKNNNDPFYALILGSDTRVAGQRGRSDTIILTRVDPDKKTATLISIPRDTKVEFEGKTIKINAAYAKKGEEGAIKAVSDLAGVPINHVVSVDFDGVKGIVDKLGGVTVKVPPKTTYGGVSVPEGVQKLDGVQALTFARVRKTYASGDYQRTDNQRQLVKAVAKEILATPVNKLPGVVESIASAVNTDMPLTKLISLSLKMRGMDIDKMYNAVLPSAPKTINGASYVVVKEAEWKTMMERVKAGLPPLEEKAPDAAK